MFLRLFIGLKSSSKQLPFSCKNCVFVSTSTPRCSEPDNDGFGTLDAPLEKRTSKKRKNVFKFQESTTTTETLQRSDRKFNQIIRDSPVRRDVFGTKNSSGSYRFNEGKGNFKSDGMGRSDPKTRSPISTTSKQQRSSYRKKREPDVFGKLAENELRFKIQTVAERIVPEEVDILPSEQFRPMDIKRKRFIDYAKDIRKLSHEKKLKEALELFESLSEIGVRYEKDRFLYCVIISACAKQGYTKKAFQIYAKMRQNDLKPSAGVLTGLFNACAECPFPEYGLEKAQTLHRKMKEEGWHPSQITYHAMIKAYGRCNDLASAFALADEMKQEGFAITNETFAFLLQACISDKDAGFSYAISVMRKMHAMKIKPTLYSYNLLLRVVRDCGIGPPELSSKLLLDWLNPQDWLNRPNNKLLPAGSLDSLRTNQLASGPTYLENEHATSKPNSTSASKVPPETSFIVEHSNQSEGRSLQLQECSLDLLAPKPQGAQILALGKVTSSADRLALVGGPHRIVTKLENLGYKPDMKTFTLLLESQESCETAETLLLKLMRESKVQPDIDFFNVLIKKRCLRYDYAGAKDVLLLIAEFKLYPDVATFGTLAMACSSRSLSKTLCKDLKSAGFKLNIKIAGALMRNAFVKMDFDWMLDLMEVLSEHGVKPCPIFLSQLEEAQKNGGQALEQVGQLNGKAPAWAEGMNFEEQYKKFCSRYKKWLKTVEVDVAKHPWEQFKLEKKVAVDGVLT